VKPGVRALRPERDKMKKEEALEMLRNAPQGNIPARVNPALTQSQAIGIVMKYVNGMKDGATLNDLAFKRVLQVCQNRKRPNESLNTDQKQRGDNSVVD
jgi:hypothetical protein